jgi:hypothetical protein
MNRDVEKEPKPEWTLERFASFIQARSSRLLERLTDMEEDLVSLQLATEIEVACADVLREIAPKKSPDAGEERRPMPLAEGMGTTTNEVRGEQRGYSWRVFYHDVEGASQGWRGEWKAPTGETGRPPLSSYPTAREAEDAVLACIEEHRTPTFTVPLEEK